MRFLEVLAYVADSSLLRPRGRESGGCEEFLRPRTRAGHRERLFAISNGALLRARRLDYEYFFEREPLPRRFRMIFVLRRMYPHECRRYIGQIQFFGILINFAAEIKNRFFILESAFLRRGFQDF